MVHDIKTLPTPSLLALKDVVASKRVLTLIDDELSKRTQECQLTNVIYYT